MNESLADRKKRHLDVCLDEGFQVESGSTELNRIKLHHRSVPTIDPQDLDLTTEFLGSHLRLPLMISSMTGGTEEGRRLNMLLAEAANAKGIAIGTGSIRVMLRHSETAAHFRLKDKAPNVPVLANIGAAQLVEYQPQAILDAVKSLSADGLYVHLNPAQEIFQNGGDSNFSQWRDGVRRFLDAADIPVLFKETGAGIPPVEGLELLRLGARFIDVAGSGGTDWVAVEAYQKGGGEDDMPFAFRCWGYSTGELLLSYREVFERDPSIKGSGCLIASGGLRSSLDYAVALGCGASLAASALPFIRVASKEGLEGVLAYIDDIESALRAAIVLSGASSLEDFRRSSLRVPEDLRNRALTLADEAI